MVEKWIQKAVGKPGTLHRMLEIPKEKDIPMTLLKKIIAAEKGDVIINPTKTGKKRIKVTRLLERRAILAVNLKNISKEVEKFK